MILILRGHIRNSFDTLDLKHLVNEIYKIDPQLQIYIHTWNVFSNNISWRKVDENYTPVTKENIYHYFGGLQHLIKHIIIDDDARIQLVGNVTGNVCKSKMPVKGWKNYWYGQYKMIQYVQGHASSNEFIINTRFDILSNSNSFEQYEILRFIRQHKEATFTKNKFMFEKNQLGIDNLYIGNVGTMNTLVSAFFYNLDDIQKKHPNILNQEYLVFIVNDETHFSWGILLLTLFLCLMFFGLFYMNQNKKWITSIIPKNNDGLKV
jgi:hypothetical protein